MPSWQRAEALSLMTLIASAHQETATMRVMTDPYDYDKIDEMVLALLWLTMHKDRVAVRAWKGHDWDALDRLHGKGYISDPATKAKSVVMTEEGAKRAEELFEKHFLKR
jgi:uncharacterized protein DUF6429